MLSAEPEEDASALITQVLQEEVAALKSAEDRLVALTAASFSAVPASSKARRAAAAMSEAHQQIAASRILMEGPRAEPQVLLESRMWHGGRLMHAL